MAARLSFWIMERINPQTGTYYKDCGQLRVVDARKKEQCLYGAAIMHRFSTEAEKDARVQELKEANERFI